MVAFNFVGERSCFALHANASFAERKATMAMLAFYGRRQAKVENLLIQFKGGSLAFNVAFRSAKVALPWVGFHKAFGFE